MMNQLLALSVRSTDSGSAAPPSLLLSVGQKRKRPADAAQRNVLPATASPLNPADVVALETKGFFAVDALAFLATTEEMVAAYRLDVVNALRTEKVDELRKLHDAGAQLQCCNRFGESLIHMACRRGLTDVVRFLVRDAKVSLLVKDDYGRTPLHDACWTPQPRFDLVRFILEEVPALLCVEDVRGHLPLHYVRKEHWGDWCDFFAGHKSMLQPKLIPSDCLPRREAVAKSVSS